MIRNQDKAAHIVSHQLKAYKFKITFFIHACENLWKRDQLHPYNFFSYLGESLE